MQSAQEGESQESSRRFKRLRGKEEVSGSLGVAVSRAQSTAVGVEQVQPCRGEKVGVGHLLQEPWHCSCCQGLGKSSFAH